MYLLFEFAENCQYVTVNVRAFAINEIISVNELRPMVDENVPYLFGYHIPLR
jgi:hypothetical protein